MDKVAMYVECIITGDFEKLAMTKQEKKDYGFAAGAGLAGAALAQPGITSLRRSKERANVRGSGASVDARASRARRTLARQQAEALRKANKAGAKEFSGINKKVIKEVKANAIKRGEQINRASANALGYRPSKVKAFVSPYKNVLRKLVTKIK